MVEGRMCEIEGKRNYPTEIYRENISTAYT
jgi:hypothetical protein